MQKPRAFQWVPSGSSSGFCQWAFGWDRPDRFQMGLDDICFHGGEGVGGNYHEEAWDESS